MKIHPHVTRRHAKGFSLIEMMVAITVGLVLITVCLSSTHSKSSTKRQDS